MAKLWRNKKLAGQKVTIVSRRLDVDSAGFVRTELLPDEVDKLHRVKGDWVFIDEFSEHVIEESIAELTRVLKTETDALDAAANVLRTHQRRVDAIREKIEAVRASVKPVAAVPQVTEETPFRELVKVADDLGIETDGASRDAIEGAVLAATEAVKESKGSKRKKDGDK